MTRDDRDRDLRRTFAELREEDRRGLPSFERLVTVRRGARPDRPALRLAIAALGLVAVVGALWIARRPESGPQQPEVEALLAWSSPTEFLLRTPGRELASELPSVGDVDLSGLGLSDLRPTNDAAAPLTPRKEDHP